MSKTILPLCAGGEKHAGKLVSKVVCPTCGLEFTECERCCDSDKRCVPCLEQAVRAVVRADGSRVAIWRPPSGEPDEP